MTKEDVLYYNRKELQEKEIRHALCEACDRFGGTLGAARTIGWSEEEIAGRLDRPPLPDIPGQPLPSLTADDLRTRTRPQVRQKIEYGRILAVQHLGSNYVIALFLGPPMREWHVRRVIKGEAALARSGRLAQASLSSQTTTEQFQLPVLADRTRKDL